MQPERREHGGHMGKNKFGRGALLIVMLFTFTASTAYAQDSALTTEIKTWQDSVNNGQDFVVSTIVRNVSKEDLSWPDGHAACSSFPARQWTADNPSIHVVVEDACSGVKENPLVSWNLKAGEVFEWPLIVRAN